VDAFFRALVAAARLSSNEVLAVLDRAVRSAGAGVDATLFFELRDETLLAIYAGRGRAADFLGLSLRCGGDSLPARAALLARHLARTRSGGAVIPTDRGAIAIPMISERCIRGVWYAASSALDCVQDGERLVRLVDCACEPYALALEREADRNDAAFDTLTGVLGPNAFRRRLYEYVGRGDASVLSLWFVDTDRFKAVNDDCGHAAGDRVLQRMAALLNAHAVPEADVVGRKGGDEFCMIVRGPAKMRAIERAGGFCRAVRAHDFGLPVRITTSVGVAAYPFDARSAPELLERADAAMYYAKRSGRDRVAYAVEGSGFALYE
jgi:diguanylate cyclase (GGDEF)-like protein